MSFWYLATPYSKYPKGVEEAFREASKQAALLIAAGVPTFCPIAHTHPIAIHGNVNHLDHNIWLPNDEHFMRMAKGLLVCQMATWEISYGILKEIEFMTALGKPIRFMVPSIVPDLL